MHKILDLPEEKQVQYWGEIIKLIYLFTIPLNRQKVSILETWIPKFLWEKYRV
jgi:hypothetical protein